MSKRKALLTAAFLSAVSGATFIATHSPAQAAPSDRKLCDQYPLANSQLPEDTCRSNSGRYTS